MVTNRREQKIVVIGGGTGSFMLLNALKGHFKNLTALVNMVDDGGSTGQLRDELGVLPPGDVRQCLVALSRSPKVRDLFNYRFEEGSLKGHSFGNLFLTALEKLTGDFSQALQTAGEVLNTEGAVVPITLDNVRLVLKTADDTKIHGEGKIDEAHFWQAGARPDLSLSRGAILNPAAQAAILEADCIVIAPGDIYTSLGPLLIVAGVGAALKKSRAKKIYLCNLVVKAGHTNDFDVADHAAEIERFAGERILDVVLYNTARPSRELSEKYARDGELLVKVRPTRLATQHYISKGLPLISTERVAAQKGDALAAHRSLIRHDGDAVARVLIDLCRN